MIWRELVPLGVAMKQDSFERARSVWQARQAGATLRQIALGMQLSVPRIRQLDARAARLIRENGPNWSPVAQWISISGHYTDVAKLANMTQPPVQVPGRAANGQAFSQSPAR